MDLEAQEEPRYSVLKKSGVQNAAFVELYRFSDANQNNNL